MAEVVAMGDNRFLTRKIVSHGSNTHICGNGLIKCGKTVTGKNEFEVSVWRIE